MITISYAKSQEARIRDAVALAATSVTAAQQYSLTLQNDSASPWTFYVYQQVPNQESSNVFSLAWFASPFQIVKGAQIKFTWSIDYGFVWGATGQVIPGVTFNASQQLQAGLKTANTTQFTTQPGPNMSAPATGDPAGSLVISDGGDVPNNTYSVGISMSGAGTFVTPAGPNLTHTFTPTPTYWIAAGTNVQVGRILDITTIGQTKQVQFPVNVYDLTYMLDTSNQWKKVS